MMQSFLIVLNLVELHQVLEVVDNLHALLVGARLSDVLPGRLRQFMDRVDLQLLELGVFQVTFEQLNFLL